MAGLKAQTWVIIVRFRVEKEIQKPIGPFPLGPRTRNPARVEITESSSIRLDKPMLLIPNGEAEKVEIIPITEPAVIHGRNLRRRIS